MIRTFCSLILLAATARAAAPYDAEETAVAALVDLARANRQAFCAYCVGVDSKTDCASWGANTPVRPLHYEPRASDASRFHEKHLHDGPCFQHESCCTLEKRGDGTVDCATPECSNCGFPTSCPGTAVHDRYVMLGYPSQQGENIAAGYPHAVSVMCGWMNSTGHRENILDGDYDDLGVGRYAAPSDCQNIFWGQAFGVRPDHPDPGYVPAGGLEPGSPGPPFAPANAAATAMAFVHDPAGKPAKSVRAVVDGRCVALDVSMGGSGDALYSGGVDVGAGCHELWFLAMDADGARHVFPSDEAIAFNLDESTSCPRPIGRTPAACEGANACSEEGKTRSCYDGPDGTDGVGLCHRGHETCRDGAWSGCEAEVIPQAEACNGLDDDCNGTIDDHPQDDGNSCDSGLPGACASGHGSCIAGALTCVADHDPQPELCNGIDDDCDGEVDDGLGELTCGDGACRVIVPACANGIAGSCPAPRTASETCGNGLDDDCNGSPDDGCPCSGPDRACYTGTLATEGVGACHAGVQRCVNGTWGACEGQQLPSAETCNGVDDDCNKVIDEGFGRTTCGEGACRTTGARCVGGRLRDCEPLAAHPETCNGLDDSCDGTVDEGCTCRPGTSEPCYSGDWSLVGVGTCRAGAKSCSSDGRGFSDCEGEVLPAKEICGNALDDDCNGIVDDGCPPPSPPDAGSAAGSASDARRGGCGCTSPLGAGAASLVVLALVRRRKRA